jgi:hypothetical protein
VIPFAVAKSSHPIPPEASAYLLHELIMPDWVGPGASTEVVGLLGLNHHVNSPNFSSEEKSRYLPGSCGN